MPSLNFDFSKINLTFASSLRENETLWNTAFCARFSCVQIVDCKNTWKVKILIIQQLVWLVHFRQRPLENEGLTRDCESFFFCRDIQFAYKFILLDYFWNSHFWTIFRLHHIALYMIGYIRQLLVGWCQNNICTTANSRELVVPNIFIVIYFETCISVVSVRTLSKNEVACPKFRTPDLAQIKMSDICRLASN